MNQDTIIHTRVARQSSAFKAMPKLGAGLTGLVVLFLAFDGITKVIRVTPVIEACQKAGIAADLVTGVGVLLLACTAIYVIPKTAILGAILSRSRWITAQSFARKRSMAGPIAKE